MGYYFDTSALTKLVVAEAKTDALQSWLRKKPRDPISSDLARTELLRAVRRLAPERLVQAREVLESLTLMEVTTELFEEAGLLDPAIVRSLDALHVATALSLGDEVEGFVTYDDRQTEAAQANGLKVVAPT